MCLLICGCFILAVSFSALGNTFKNPLYLDFICTVGCLMVLTVSITTISAGPIKGCWIYLPLASYPASDSAWCYILQHKVKPEPVISFPHLSLSFSFSWPLQMGSAPCFGTDVILCKQITCLAFNSPSKTQNFKSSQLKSSLSPLLTSLQLLQAVIPTFFFLHFHCFFLQQPNQMGMVIALHKKAESGIAGKLKEVFTWILRWIVFLNLVRKSGSSSW